MSNIAQNLWLIPLLPLSAAAITALLPKTFRRTAAALAIVAIAGAFALSMTAFARVLGRLDLKAGTGEVVNFPWMQLGSESVRLGWVLDPLSAVMLVMVTLVGLLIFIYSLGYMASDENFARFFCFLSFFAAAMLGLVIANSLLLLFICWELVGLASYLLIGFWYKKPSAAAAAKKAFITTRIGDLAFLLGMVWLYAQTGSLLFFDGGRGFLEDASMRALALRTTALGLPVCTGIGLLLFFGAVGKSGQVPLHVWLPDAMEGPTPVSALIHAATMVAAGVFLVARVYPLMAITPGQESVAQTSLVLTTVTWVGALTALFAASIAVAQTDIKRILAYSTVSQLGFMMMGLGVGGVAVGMFHLVAHAFFKALLFLGAGSIIHGCHDEQDVRKMGGVRRFMPITFATYAVGMMALSGVPLLFSGFWSKDEILHAAHAWPVSHGPFYIGLAGAFLTAFYMTRQVVLVFFGRQRATARSDHGHATSKPHESPGVMTIPLVVLSVLAVVFGFLGTPAWPWFQTFLSGTSADLDFGALAKSGTVSLMAVSGAVALAGIGLGLWVYGRRPPVRSDDPDPLAKWRPDIFSLLRNKYWIDEAYEVTFIRLVHWFASLSHRLDAVFWGGLVQLTAWIVLGASWINRLFDEYVVNGAFDQSCRGVTTGGGWLARLQNGLVQHYLLLLAGALVILLILSLVGCGAP